MNSAAITADKVTSHFMSRLIDSGNLIFSTDFSYITCANCQHLLSPEGGPVTCGCGASILCLSCQREQALTPPGFRDSLPCGCSVADENLNELQMRALDEVKLRCKAEQCTDVLSIGDVIKHDALFC